MNLISWEEYMMCCSHVEDIEELEELEELEDIVYPSHVLDEGMIMVGALDYVENAIPTIRDDGAEFTIVGFGSIHKRNPEWIGLRDLIISYEYRLDIDDERMGVAGAQEVCSQ